MALYHVYYTSKFNGTEKAFVLDIPAKTAKEACDECKRLVFKTTGRNAFRPKAMVTDKLPVGVSCEPAKGYPPPKIGGRR